MNLRFNASGRMVWDVATAVAWRMDPDRRLVSEFVKDRDINTAVEGVFVEKAETIRTPPRLQKYVEELRSRFPGAITEIMEFIVTEHIYAALNSDVSEAIQDPGRAPFLIIGKDRSRESILIDIDVMLAEYRNAPTQVANRRRQGEEAIKQIIRNSVTPRFDRVEVRLEEVSRKLDEGFNRAASRLDQRFGELMEEIRKPKPPQL